MRRLLPLLLVGCSAGPPPAAPAAPEWRRELDALSVAWFLDGELDNEGRLRLARLKDFEANEGAEAVEAVRGLDGARAEAFRAWRAFETGGSRPEGAAGAPVEGDPVSLREAWLAAGDGQALSLAFEWVQTWPDDASGWFAVGVSAAGDEALPPEVRVATANRAFARARARDPSIVARPASVPPAADAPPCRPDGVVPDTATWAVVDDVRGDGVIWRFRSLRLPAADVVPRLAGRILRAEALGAAGRRIPGVVRGDGVHFDEAAEVALLESVERLGPDAEVFDLAGHPGRVVYTLHAATRRRVDSRDGAPAGMEVPGGACGAWAWRVELDEPPARIDEPWAPRPSGPHVVEVPPLRELTPLLEPTWPVRAAVARAVGGMEGLFLQATHLHPGAGQLEPAGWIWARGSGNRALALRAALPVGGWPAELWWARNADGGGRHVVRVGPTWLDPEGEHGVYRHLPPELRGAEAESLERPGEVARLPAESPVEDVRRRTLALRLEGDGWVGTLAAERPDPRLDYSIEPDPVVLTGAVPGVVLEPRSPEAITRRDPLGLRAPTSPDLLRAATIAPSPTRPDLAEYLAPRRSDLVLRGAEEDLRATLTVPAGFHLETAWDSFERSLDGVTVRQRVELVDGGLVLERQVRVGAARIPAAAHETWAASLRALLAKLNGRVAVRRADAEAK